MEGEGGKGLIGRPLSVLVCSREVVGVWWVALLGARCGLFQLDPTGSLPPPMLLWRGCGGVVGLSVLRLPLSWPLRDLGGF